MIIMLKVSVIIPTYNYAPYIQEAIESVLSQTYKDIEIIVIDDGSTDNTKEILADYIKSEKICYIYQENRGLPAARNTGLKVAQGQFIKFLDSDDFLYPEEIEKQVAQIKNNDNFISLSDHCILTPDGSIVKHKFYPPDDNHQLASFFETNPAPPHAYLTPKTLIDKVGGFDETLKACEDWDLWLRILQQGAVIRHTPYAGCCYRITNASMSSDRKSMLIHKCKVIEKANIWLFQEENRARYDTNQCWLESTLKINIRIIEECFARRMPFKHLFKNSIKNTGWLFRANSGFIMKVFTKMFGIVIYLKLRYFFRTILNKEYEFYLINEDKLWKMEKNPENFKKIVL